VLFARDVGERERCKKEHDRYLSRIGDVDVLSGLDLRPFTPAKPVNISVTVIDFRIPVIEGTGEESAARLPSTDQSWRFFLGYLDEGSSRPVMPQPEILSRNGSYLAYLRLQEHVGAFRDFLRQQGQTPDEQELVAAKLMGRWRSGAPLVLAPQKDDPALGVDLQRTNNFDYGKMDPYGYGCPVGAHIRRMNPRDTADNMQRRQMIRREAPTDRC